MGRREKPKLLLKLMLKLILRLTHGYTTVVSMEAMAMVTLTMPLLPTAMLPTPTLMSTTTMVSDTMVSAIAATKEERRGKLRLSQRLLLILRLTHGYCMAAMPAMDMVLVMDMPMPLTPMLPTITHLPTSMAAA